MRFGEGREVSRATSRRNEIWEEHDFNRAIGRRNEIWEGHDFNRAISRRNETWEGHDFSRAISRRKWGGFSRCGPLFHDTLFVKRLHVRNHLPELLIGQLGPRWHALPHISIHQQPVQIAFCGLLLHAFAS